MTQDISAEQLRALRLAAGLEPSALARQVSLSTAQLLQLESDQGSLFYTPAIRRQAARKVYSHLTGHWPADSDLVRPSANDQGPQIEEPVTDSQPGQVVKVPAAEPVEALAPATTQPTRGRWLLRPVLVSSALFLGLGLSGWLVAGRPLPQATQSSPVQLTHLPAAPLVADSRLSSPDQGARSASGLDRNGPLKGQPLAPSAPTNQDLVAAMPASGMPLSPALREDLSASAACHDTAEPVAALQLPATAAQTVRLVSAVAQWVCVTDGAGQSRPQQLAAGQGTVLAGSPPWVVQAGSLTQVQIYAQGKRLPWPAGMNNRIRLFVSQ